LRVDVFDPLVSRQLETTTPVGDGTIPVSAERGGCAVASFVSRPPGAPVSRLLRLRPRANVL